MTDRKRRARSNRARYAASPNMFKSAGFIIFVMHILPLAILLTLAISKQ